MDIRFALRSKGPGFENCDCLGTTAAKSQKKKKKKPPKKSPKKKPKKREKTKKTLKKLDRKYSLNGIKHIQRIGHQCDLKLNSDCAPFPCIFAFVFKNKKAVPAQGIIA